MIPRCKLAHQVRVEDRQLPERAPGEREVRVQSCCRKRRSRVTGFGHSTLSGSLRPGRGRTRGRPARPSRPAGTSDVPGRARSGRVCGSVAPAALVAPPLPHGRRPSSGSVAECAATSARRWASRRKPAGSTPSEGTCRSTDQRCWGRPTVPWRSTETASSLGFSHLLEMESHRVGVQMRGAGRSPSWTEASPDRATSW